MRFLGLFVALFLMQSVRARADEIVEPYPPSPQPVQPYPRVNVPASPAPAPGQPIYSPMPAPPQYAQPPYAPRPQYTVPPHYDPQPGYAPQPIYPYYVAPCQTCQQPLYQQPFMAPIPAAKQEFKMVPRTGLIVGGSVLFAVSYIMTAAIGIGVGENYLAIPLFGPAVQLSKVVNEPFRSFDQSFVAVFGGAGLVIDLIVQNAGMAMIIGGAATKRRVPVGSARVMPAANGLRVTF